MYGRSLTFSHLQIHVLEQDAFEVLRLLRFWRNRLAPISRIPPEVLTLIPDFWDTRHRDQGVIALTHVCRAWREIFTSCPSLWSDFDCEDVDKTQIYLDRSKSSPIDLRLKRVESLSPHDPFFQVVPHAVTRLKSLSIHGTPENLQDIATLLSHPVSILETLAIEVDLECTPQDGLVVETMLFDGDLSSLRELQLKCVHTVLPWRNMVNLTSFTLGYTLLGNFPIRHLLNFFESAPRLRKIQLHSATPTFGAQNGRLVSLAHLERMEILGGGPSSLLLDHLLIPVGAKLTTRVGLDLLGPAPGGSMFDGHLPRSLSNLRNFSDFTEIHLHIGGFYPRIRFSGPNGQVTMISATPRDTTVTTYRVYESLARFDTSKIERLRINAGDLWDNRGNCSFFRALYPMRALRTLTISRCKNISTSIDILHDDCLCPKLEELILDPRVHGEKFDIQAVVGTLASRTSWGLKLKSVKIVSADKSVQTCALKLEEYVPHVECSPRVAAVCDGDSSDEED